MLQTDRARQQRSPALMIIYQTKIKLRAVASQAVYVVDFLMGGRNFISRVYCLASPM